MDEQWREIPGYEGLYEASDAGRIRNSKSGLILKPYARGLYLCVSLFGPSGRKTPEVHPIILKTFVGPRPSGLVAAHLDGKGTNNCLSNLAWVTPAENEAHKLIHGTHNRGRRSPHAKFTDEQVAIIREICALGVSANKLSILLGVYVSTIADIVGGETYQPDQALRS